MSKLLKLLMIWIFFAGFLAGSASTGGAAASGRVCPDPANPRARWEGRFCNGQGGGGQAGPQVGGGFCIPTATTTLNPRAAGTINGTPVRLQVRDTTSCARPLFYNETGVAAGTNYRIDVPQGWSVITAAVTTAVHREGGIQHDYTDTPVIVIRGPFRGGAGIYEGAIRVVPSEWEQAVLNQTLSLQSHQTGQMEHPIFFDH